MKLLLKRTEPSARKATRWPERGTFGLLVLYTATSAAGNVPEAVQMSLPVTDQMVLPVASVLLRVSDEPQTAIRAPPDWASHRPYEGVAADSGNARSGSPGGWRKPGGTTRPLEA